MCFSSPKTPCWHNVQNLFSCGTRRQHPASLGSLWQPILKRCMQCTERGKSRRHLAWQPAGLAAQFLWVRRRESPVGQVLGHMARFQNFSLCLEDITQMPNIVVQPVCKAVQTLHITFQVLQVLFSRSQKVLNHPF